MDGFFISGLDQSQGGGGGVNLPINAEQVNYNNAVSGLNSTTIQTVVDELKGIIDKNSSVYVVQDKQEFDSSIAQGLVLKDGDIVYFVDSIGVVDYDNQDIDNDGKPVSMIYDNNILTQGSNRLRLFSELKVVKDWKDLSSTTVVENKNLFDPAKVVRRTYYDTSGNEVLSTQFDSYVFPCNKDDVIRLVKKDHDSSTIVFLDENKKLLRRISSNGTIINNFHVYDITATDDGVKYIGFNLHKQTLGINKYTDTVMIFRGTTFTPTEYVPYTGDGFVSINGDNVKTTFNNVGTGLRSTYIDEAIKELDEKKIINLYKGIDVFDKNNNTFNAAWFRIPTLTRTKNATLLAFADIRYNTSKDQSFIDVGCARSTDNGKTWDYQIAAESDKTDPNYSRVMDSTVVVTKSNRIILLIGGWNTSQPWGVGTEINRPDWHPYIVISDDDGKTWSNKISLKTELINNQPNPNACANVPTNVIGWFGGVGTGIVKENGSNIGRIILPAQITTRTGSVNSCYSTCIYSDNNGTSWTMGTHVPDANTSENMILELDNGDLIMSARRDVNNSRGAYISRNGGESWEVYTPLHGKFTYGNGNNISGCQGSWIKYVAKNGHEIGLISYPKNPKANSSSRDYTTIYMYNFTKPNGIIELFTTTNGAGGYSSICCKKDVHGRESLYTLNEQFNGKLIFKDISFLLDKIDSIASIGNWEGLDYVSVQRELVFKNMYPTTTIEKVGQIMNGNGNIDNNSKWNTYLFPVKYGETYCFSNIKGDNGSGISYINGSSTCVEYNTHNNTFDSNTRLANGAWTHGGNHLGRNYLQYKPTNPNVTHIGINVIVTNSDNLREIMIWDKSVMPFEKYIADAEKTNPKSIVIDGDEVETQFSGLTGTAQTKLKPILQELLNRATGSGTVTRFYANTETSTFSRVGKIETYICKLPTETANFSSNPTETQILLEKYSHIPGEKVNINGECWVKCEGQEIDDSITGNPLTLPISLEGNYIYLCLGN